MFSYAYAKPYTSEGCHGYNSFPKLKLKICSLSCNSIVTLIFIFGTELKKRILISKLSVFYAATFTTASAQDANLRNPNNCAPKDKQILDVCNQFQMKVVKEPFL